MSNLLKRTVSGAVFLALVITALLWNEEAYLFVFLLFMLIMMMEYLKISTGYKESGDADHFPQAMAICAGLVLFYMTFDMKGNLSNLKNLHLVFLVILFILTIASVLFSKRPDQYRILPYLFTSVVYIALPFSMCNLIVFQDGTFNATPLLAVLILLWSSDVGAYIFGMTLRNIFPMKLCPSISPKKTVIGYVGGLIITLLAGYILAKTGMLGCGIIHSLIIAAIVNVTGTIGDLAESQFKRHFGIKDSGNIMPGHGGLLDRFDGALLAFPAAVTYLLLIN